MEVVGRSVDECKSLLERTVLLGMTAGEAPRNLYGYDTIAIGS